MQMLDSIITSVIPLYTYCEVYNNPITQPLNFLSCIVFWLAAVWLGTRVDQDDEKPSFHQVSAIILFILGLSGMAWHVSGNPIAQAIDLFALFMLLIVITSALCNDVLRMSLKRGMFVVIALLFAGALLKDASFLPQNGGMLLPLLFFFAVASLKAQTVNETVTVYLLSASYTLFFGLLAYCLDGVMCSYFPLGLHWLWHIMLVVSLIYISKTLVAMKAVTAEKPELKIEADA